MLGVTARAAADKMIVFGLLKHNGKLYTAVVSDTKSSTKCLIFVLKYDKIFNAILLDGRGLKCNFKKVLLSNIKLLLNRQYNIGINLLILA
jgi:transposase